MKLLMALVFYKYLTLKNKQKKKFNDLSNDYRNEKLKEQKVALIDWLEYD